jgi:hypothetical protein
MMVYARLCLVSKNWGRSIAAELMASVRVLDIDGRTDEAFAPLAILLRHCGAPVLEQLFLNYKNDSVSNEKYCSGIYVQAILERLAAGRAPKIEALAFNRLRCMPLCIRQGDS